MLRSGRASVEEEGRRDLIDDGGPLLTDFRVLGCGLAVAGAVDHEERLLGV